MKKFKETGKGFTLVEVMVALILLTLSFMVFLQALNTGKTVRAHSELRTIQSVIMNSVENQIRARRFDEKISAPWSTVLGSESYSDSY
ncbi:MAG: prepilin-type N-terminal cleavage/methylation domain-containing protein, partial [Candidatus Neomarinimicrobiota bacterium]|nr:prepilin-type N-terminal cleavage/methylation domain-containing protein [Candidatus Neomarinimicrobiota bacterium]